MKRRYFIYFSYNGSAYHGWQIQPNGVSVQETLEKALSTILRNPIPVTGAGRTDTGVHARMMVAHFDSDAENINSEALVKKLNSLLPCDIAVTQIRKVKPTAHARFDATARRYEYHLVTSKNVFLNGLATRENQQLDFESMNKAAALLPTYTDFTSFSKLHTDVKTNNCKITRASWEQKDDKWVFTIEADRFLRNMVRAVVGTLFEVGRHKLTIDQFIAVIEAKDRCKAGSSVPAHGLYLVDVRYPEDIFIDELTTNREK